MPCHADWKYSRRFRCRQEPGWALRRCLSPEAPKACPGIKSVQPPFLKVLMLLEISLHHPSMTRRLSPKGALQRGANKRWLLGRPSVLRPLWLPIRRQIWGDRFGVSLRNFLQQQVAAFLGDVGRDLQPPSGLSELRGSDGRLDLEEESQKAKGSGGEDEPPSPKDHGSGGGWQRTDIRQAVRLSCANRARVATLGTVEILTFVLETVRKGPTDEKEPTTMVLWGASHLSGQIPRDNLFTTQDSRERHGLEVRTPVITYLQPKRT